jgi:MYXO-CTERM domain-containing protein
LPGYASTPGGQPICSDFDACGAGSGDANCVTTQGNSCLDLPPPSTSYQCGCSNVAYTASGTTACVNKNECLPVNHCGDGGDSGATCADHPAPATGYDCNCSTPSWTAGTVGGHNSCVDTNECASGNPCLNGTCTNVAAGGGYSCVCDAGFVLAGGIPSPSPTCVHQNGCFSHSAGCLPSQAGNACVDEPPPSTGFHCTCGNPAYVASSDGKSCVDKNECQTNHCGDGGDQKATCLDHPAPASGYDCSCGPGWSFDGTTCRDRDECLGAGNPCGPGICSNTKGGYQCDCPNGFAVSAGAAPTCVSTAPTKVSFTTTAGSGCGCSAGGADSPSATGLALLLGLLTWAASRRKRLRR